MTKNFVIDAGISSGKRKGGIMRRFEEFKTFTALLSVIVIWLLCLGLLYLFDRGCLWGQKAKRKIKGLRG